MGLLFAKDTVREDFKRAVDLLPVDIEDDASFQSRPSRGRKMTVLCAVVHFFQGRKDTRLFLEALAVQQDAMLIGIQLKCNKDDSRDKFLSESVENMPRKRFTRNQHGTKA